MTITTIDPSTGASIHTYEELDAAAVTEAIARADHAHASWRRVSMPVRGAVLERVADELDRRAPELATLMATEMGKPVQDGRAEAEKCAWACRHYAAHAEEYLADIPMASDHATSYVRHEPLGVVLAVMPWNFPLWQVIRFAAPALMAGNAAVLKHASGVTGTGLALQDLMEAAGVPADLFRALVLPSGRVDEVIEDRLVRAVTLTGSGAAGAAVAASVGRQLKKCVLELGGSDPYLVLEDADVDFAASVCADSRMTNNGQSCIAAKRFIVHDSIHDRFVDRLVHGMESKTMGDPHDEDTDVGPMARADLRDELHRQVTDSIDAGAGLVTGGRVPDGPGAWYPATVLTDVAPSMPAYDDELFGPVAAVIRVDSEAEAVRVANDTEFGLGAAVFTRDVQRGERLAAQELRAGSCFVNGLVASDPRLPFGGIKRSGFGRELADLGIREFVNAKTVAVA